MNTTSKAQTRRFLLVISIWFIVAFNGFSQQTPRETDGWAPLGYLEYLPPDYDANPTKKYPLIIFLHGLNERGDGSAGQLERVKRHGIPKLIEQGHNMCFTVDGKEECFIVISPQLRPTDDLWYEVRVDKITNHVLTGSQNYRIDESRVYLTGLSLGGMGTWGYIYNERNADNKFAAASIIAGQGSTNNNNGCKVSERGIAIWAFHGSADNVVRYSGGLTMFNAVKDCTSPVPTQDLVFTTYDGVGHNSWDRAYRTDNSLHTPNLYQWFLSKSLGGNPTADAGADQNITLPTNSITLSGSGTDSGGSIDVYSWTKVTGPAATLSNENTTDLTVSDMVEGAYTFELTVTDNDSNTASDQVVVIVSPEVVNQPPTVNAGNDVSITLPTNSTNLTAVASDTDGSVDTYLWSQRSGPSTATLAGTATNVLTASGLVEGTYQFRITVTDNDNASVFDEVSVTVLPEVVNTPPTANAGADQVINLPTNSTNLNGSGSDPDGSIATYLWEKVGGPAATLTNPNTAVLTLAGLLEGIYTFRLTVTDNDGATDSDDVVVTVIAANQNPTANAGADITITLPTNSIILNGSGADADGTIASYAWVQLSGPSTSNVVTPSAAVTVVNGLVEGVYEMQLTVTDNDGAEDIDVTNITVLSAPVNVPPAVSAGEDESITLPTNSVVLAGTANDTDGTISSYTWSKITGPSTFALSGETTSTLTASDLVAGNYIFRLTVVDNDGATAFDDVQVNVAPEIVNQAPSANAGPNRLINLPMNMLVLNGSGTDNDGTVASFAWTKTSGPAATLSGENTADLSLSDLVEGIYTFQLVVTDDQGATGTDEAIVTVNAANLPPTVSAGDDVFITLPTNSVTIDGTSSDSDGTVTTIQWQQISGTSLTFSGNTSTLSLSGLTEGTYTFRFSATDDDGATASDDVDIFVIALNQFPSVNAGSDQTLTLPVNSTNLTATASDTDGTIASYNWQQASGPAVTLVNQTNRTVTLNDLVEGIYVFTVTVTDNDGGTDSDNVRVTVLPAATNSPPTANAGPNRNITLPNNSLNLFGSGSDPDGSIASYLWTKQSGPNIVLIDNNRATLSLTGLVEGTYIFRLTVTDDDGAQDFDETRVIVTPAAVNQTPSANAGRDIQVSLPTNSTNLVGSGSDPDGSIVGYLWAQIAGPGPATLVGADRATLTVNGLTEGNYTFRLTVTDDDGASDNDEVNVTVLAAAVNEPPLANAGPDRSIVLPTNTINIAGTASDPDGSITEYLWTKVSGPAATLSNANISTLTAAGLSAGTYTFRLRVRDNDGATAIDEMVLRVLPEAINESPIANAGPDIELILPNDSAQVNGSATDRDGAVISYLWTQVQGGNADLMNVATPTLDLSGLEEGNYIFRLTATDDDGAIGTDEMAIIVFGAGTNSPPVANAGPGVTISLPTNTLTINGNATDADGTVTGFSWEKVSGPSVTLSGTDQQDLQLSDLIEGSYLFRLTVTDDQGDSDADEVSVTVLPQSTNLSPTADAGPDIFIELPQPGFIITGQGSDPDGTIQGYQWSQVSGGADLRLDNTSTANLTISGYSVGQYTLRLTVTDDGGLESFDEVNVFVENDQNAETPNTPPIVDLGFDRILVLPENSVEINALVEDDGLISDFNWEQLSGNPATTSSPSESSLLVEDLTAGNYIFRLTVTDNFGSSSSDELELQVVENSQFPMKLFSPNGDGDNDFWILDPDLDKFTFCTLQIFDRQGSVVYETTSYQNTWDATRNGGELREGVYYYVVKCENDVRKSGSITVIR